MGLDVHEPVVSDPGHHEFASGPFQRTAGAGGQISRDAALLIGPESRLVQGAIDVTNDVAYWVRGIEGIGAGFMGGRYLLMHSKPACLHPFGAVNSLPRKLAVACSTASTSNHRPATRPRSLIRLTSLSTTTRAASRLTSPTTMRTSPATA